MSSGDVLDAALRRQRSPDSETGCEMTEAAKAIDDLDAYLVELQSRVSVMPDTQQVAKRCPALLGDEVDCSGTSHQMRNGWARQCGLIHYRSQVAELRDLITTCMDGKAWSDPAGDALRAALDAQRPVEGLPALLATLDRIRARGFLGQHGHVGFTGTRGTAKTHALLCLHLSALWSGVSSVWVTTQRLVDIARDRSSYDRHDNGRGEGDLRALRRASILCIDDLADRVSDHRCHDTGVTPVAGVLLDLLNNYSGRVFVSSNLTSTELAAHPDVGPRVVSRLLADHRGVPAMGTKLSGRDQRRHAARTFLENSQVDR